MSSIDGTALTEATRDLDPAETLFIVCSKSWHTQETLVNANSARQWLLAGLGRDTAAVARHFVAVSTNAQGVKEFGIDPADMLGFWDWAGGRYSVGSAVGLSLMVAIGPDRFRQFLAGFREIDEHSTPPGIRLRRGALDRDRRGRGGSARAHPGQRAVLPVRVPRPRPLREPGAVGDAQGFGGHAEKPAG